MSDKQRESLPKKEEKKSEGEKDTSQDYSRSEQDDWSGITDPVERRKVQNRLAQRKFREKSKNHKEEIERDSENRRLAGAAYSTPEPEDLEEEPELSGVPWGSLSMGHVIKSGKNKDKERGSQRTSREGSVYRGSYGSSGLGLQLSNTFARRPPVFRGHPWLLVNTSMGRYSGQGSSQGPYFPP